MTRAPKEPTALVRSMSAAVGAIVRAEFDARLVPADIRMVDYDGERDVLAAVITGYVKHDKLPPLAAHHFAAEVHGHLWELSRETVELHNLSMALHDRGYVGTVSEYLLDIEADIPVFSLPVLIQRAERLKKLWGSRRLTAELRRMTELVSAGLMDPLDTAPHLRKIYLEIREETLPSD